MFSVLQQAKQCGKPPKLTAAARAKTPTPKNTSETGFMFLHKPRTHKKTRFSFTHFTNTEGQAMRTATREEMTATNADSLRDYLQRRWPDGVTASQLHQTRRKTFSNSEAAEMALRDLVTTGLATQSEKPPGKAGGRPTTVFKALEPERTEANTEVTHEDTCESCAAVTEKAKRKIAKIENAASLCRYLLHRFPCGITAEHLYEALPDAFPHGQAAAVALRAATDLGFLERYHRVNAGDGKHQRANETYVPIATAGD